MTSTDTPQLVVPAPEEWRDLPGYEGHYMVSSWGRVRSHKIDPRGRLIQLTAINRHSKMPTYTFTPFLNGVRSGMTVARAVCLAFHGQPPAPTMEARHIGPDLSDNQPQNLRWSY